MCVSVRIVREREFFFSISVVRQAGVGKLIDARRLDSFRDAPKEKLIQPTNDFQNNKENPFLFSFFEIVISPQYVFCKNKLVITI